MPKFTLNTFDKQIEMDFEKASIYTSKYHGKITKRSTHVPLAAKIILTTDTRMTAFIMELPLLVVNEKGDIVVYTQTRFNLASLRAVDEFRRENIYALLKEEHSTLKAKKMFGLSAEEIIRSRVITAKLEMHEIINKLSRFEEGGGF